MKILHMSLGAEKMLYRWSFINFWMARSDKFGLFERSMIRKVSSCEENQETNFFLWSCGTRKRTVTT